MVTRSPDGTKMAFLESARPETALSLFCRCEGERGDYRKLSDLPIIGSTRLGTRGQHETMGLDFMPLYENAVALIRANLETIQSGRKAKRRCHRQLTQAQLDGQSTDIAHHNDSLARIVAEVFSSGPTSTAAASSATTTRLMTLWSR